MSLPELLANSPTPGVAAGLTTLSGNGGSIASGATSMKVAAAAPATLQGTGQFHALIDSEVVVIDASTSSGSGATPWTLLTRGAEGTTAASHNDGAVIYHTLTSDALTQFITSSQTNAATPIAKSGAFTAVPGQQNFCTGAITGTLPSAPVSGAEVGITALTGTVTVNRGGTDTINEYQVTGKTTTSVPAGSSVTFKYLSGIWYLVRDSRPIGWNTAARAYLTTNQTIGIGTTAKLTLDTVDYDLGSRLDVATNHRYTPTIPGYYSISATVLMTAAVLFSVNIYKNNALYSPGNSGTVWANSVYDQVPLLLATDYVEIFIVNSQGTSITVNGGGNTFFSAKREV